MSMSKVCTSSKRWFQTYSPEHYTHYIKVKSFSEWAHAAYEKLYVYIDDDVSNSFVQDTIKRGKFSLRLARDHKQATEHYPATLRHLMTLDWEYCIRSCITIHELIKGDTAKEDELLELERHYIAQRSQFVDEDDLDMRLGRSGHAVVELAKIFNSPEFPEFSELNVILERANKPLEIDLEEIIIQVRDSVDHMSIDNKDDRFLTDLIKNYDERFAMHRKAINLVQEVVKPLKTTEDYRDEIDTKVFNELETIPKQLNDLYFNSSYLFIEKFLRG